MYAGMYTRRLYIQGGAARRGGNSSDGAVGYASPLEGNKGGATREIKGAPNGRRAPRLRHVFLDNLFGNINHREHRETRALVERGRRVVVESALLRLSRSLLYSLQARSGEYRMCVRVYERENQIYISQIRTIDIIK